MIIWSYLEQFWNQNIHIFGSYYHSKTSLLPNCLSSFSISSYFFTFLLWSKILITSFFTNNMFENHLTMNVKYIFFYIYFSTLFRLISRKSMERWLISEFYYVWEKVAHWYHLWGFVFLWRINEHNDSTESWQQFVTILIDFFLRL